MLVSWNWLKEYVDLPMSQEEAARRLMMAGLNHESTEPVGNDFCIDLEVTNNRSDCLGHIGVARELAALFDQVLRIPEAIAKTSSSANAKDLVSVTIEAPELCPRYIARVIRGLKIKPSPNWLQDRLRTIGIASISNVVDITNYVMMECGQPLHAFDFKQIRGGKIIVRQAKAGEVFPAINHVEYKLEPGMCVIADAERPIALAGVMGGATTEVSDATVDVLIEAADFSQLSTRATARKLKLHSPSSYRFERGVDPEGIEWANRRCCEMVLNLAGGELASGSVDVGTKATPRDPITLRLSQIKRVLGIEIAPERVHEIMRDLGLQIRSDDERVIVAQPPSWRRDLSREIDLIEEAARIHGYDKIPEDAAVPMAASHRSNSDRVLAKVRQVMTSVGFDEAMTTSVVTPELSAEFSPWSDADPLATNQPMLKGTDRIRRSLVPSLLEARETNEGRGNPVIELFETAKIYLPQGSNLPIERVMLSATSSGDFFALKGVVETLLMRINPAKQLLVAPATLPLMEFGKAVELRIEQQLLGYLGVLSAEGRKRFRLRSSASIFEIDLAVLESIAVLVPQYAPQSSYPAIARDLNLIVSEAIRWAELETTIRSAAGQQLADVVYLDTYRDPAKDGNDTKRLLFSMSLRADDRTLTGEEADRIRDSVLSACAQGHAARMIG